MGFRTTAYMPVVFRISATWPRVLRPEVPRGTNPTVKKRTTWPSERQRQTAAVPGQIQAAVGKRIAELRQGQDE